MRGRSAATVMEERLRKLLTGAMENVLPLINVQELEEELNREPEVVGGESWKKWEQIVLTRLLFRMAEVVALQNLRQECRSTEDGEQLKSRSDKGKRKQEGDEEGGGKRQKKDLQESGVVRRMILSLPPFYLAMLVGSWSLMKTIKSWLKFLRRWRSRPLRQPWLH